MILDWGNICIVSNENNRTEKKNIYEATNNLPVLSTPVIWPTPIIAVVAINIDNPIVIIFNA